MVLLDSNTLIHFFKGEGSVAQNLAATDIRSVGVPSVVLYELETGIVKSKEPGKRLRQLDTFLAAVAVLPFDAGDARAAAVVRASLEAQGAPIGPVDTMIAGMAVARGASVATRNVREFGRVTGIRVVNWYDPAP